MMSISTLKKKSIVCRSFYLISLVFFFSTQSLVAQSTGAIKGRVFDRETGDVLVGASVVVQGTSLGAAADFEGEFYVTHAPSGKQTLRISYIGYQTLTIQVTIVENEILKQDFRLSVQSVEGETVIITAQARGQNAAINQQLSSTGITNIVSADRIREIPDANAAESIGRLPGISIKRSSGEGNEIVVRGLQPKFNIVTINGISMPSTNENNTAVGLAGISQNMLDGIEVRKTLRAEDEANVVGGIVDLKLATAPKDLHGDAILEGMYNGLTNNLGSYRSSVHISNRFFDDKLGVIGQLNLEQADKTNNALSAGYNRDTRTTDNRGVFLTNGNFQKNDITRNRLGATVLLDYKLPNGKIQVNSIYSNFDEDRWERNDIYNVASGSVAASRNMRSVSEKNYTLVNNFNLETEVFGGATFDIGAAFTNGRRKAYTNAMGFVYDINITPPIAQAFYQNPYGKTAYDLIPNIIDTGSTADNYKISRLFREDRNFWENENTFQTNLSMPFTLSNQLSGSVKFGGKMRYKERNFDYGYDGDAGGIYGGDSDILIEILNDNPEIPWPFAWSNRPGNKNELPAYPLYGDGPEKILNDKFSIKDFAQRKWVDQIIQRARASNWANLGQWYQTVSSDLANDYQGNEKLYAGYLMIVLNWGKIISLNAGVRYEKEETNYSGYGVVDIVSSVNDILDTLKAVKRINEYFLPSATVRFNYSDWGDVRLAYSKSLARPEYYAFIPHYSADIRGSLSGNTQAGYFTAASGAAGNIHLEPAVSNNFDLIFSLYNNNIGLFTIGGFYKEIDKFFYQANFEVIDPSIDNQYLRDNNYNFSVPKGQYINIWLNLDQASYLRGAELSWQTNFWYLPFPLNGLVLGVNYTKIESKAYYYTPQKVKVYYGTRPWEFTETRIDSFQTQSLVDQPNDILNISVGYDYKDFSIRVAYNFQGKTLSYKSNYVETDGYTHNYSRLDLSVRQKLPIEGLSVQFLLSNLTQEAEKSYTFTDRYNNSEQFYGMTGSLGIRYEY
jgi:TonB-dependent receptor